MAIVVEHTPYDALFNLATQAGQAQAAQQQQAQRDKQQLMAMQIGAQQQAQRFQIQAEQQARAEEMQYQMVLMQAKRQIDMQVETSDYARQKQQLTQTLNMIRDSNDFDSKEKEQLSIEVMAKYSGLGAGISPSSFGGKTGMQDFLTKGAYKMNMSEQLQNMVDQGALDPDRAKQAAASFGLSGDYLPPEERQAMKADEAVKRYDRIQGVMDDAFSFDSKGRPLDPYTQDRIKEDDPRYGYYKTLKRQVESAKQELDKLHTSGTRQASAAVFNEALQRSPALQQMAQIYGPEAAFEKWSEKFGGGDTEKPEEKKRYSPLKTALYGSAGIVGQAAVLKNMYETR